MPNVRELNMLRKLLGVEPTDPDAMAAALSQLGLVGLPIVKVIPVRRVAATTETDSGVDLPTKGIVWDVFLDVVTVEATGATKTVDVGLLSSETGGDADGFLDGASVATTAGIKRGTITATDGTNQNYVAAAPTLGALLRTGLLGSDAAGEAAALIKTPHVLNGTAKSVTYTLGSNDFAELVANIIVVYSDLTSVTG